MIKTKRIDKPDYASTPDVWLEEIKLATYDAIQQHRSNLLEVVENEVAGYLNNSRLVNDSDEHFPNSSKLTGEYYIGDESYRVHVGPVWIQVSIQARFLEKRWRKDQKNFDYLGLEVWIRCDPSDWSFSIFRNTDSSAI